MDSNEILQKYPWICKENQKLIISPDSDGFLSALLYINYFGGEVVGYYDGKVMLCPENIDPKDCLFLDMDVYCNKIKSVGHQQVLLDIRVQRKRLHLLQEWLQKQLQRQHMMQLFLYYLVTVFGTFYLDIQKTV